MCSFRISALSPSVHTVLSLHIEHMDVRMAAELSSRGLQSQLAGCVNRVALVQIAQLAGSELALASATKAAAATTAMLRPSHAASTASSSAAAAAAAVRSSHAQHPLTLAANRWGRDPSLVKQAQRELLHRQRSLARAGSYAHPAPALASMASRPQAAEAPTPEFEQKCIAKTFDSLEHVLLQIAKQPLSSDAAAAPFSSSATAAASHPHVSYRSSKLSWLLCDTLRSHRAASVLLLGFAASGPASLQQAKHSVKFGARVHEALHTTRAKQHNIAAASQDKQHQKQLRQQQQQQQQQQQEAQEQRQQQQQHDRPDSVARALPPESADELVQDVQEYLRAHAAEREREMQQRPQQAQRQQPTPAPREASASTPPPAAPSVVPPSASTASASSSRQSPVPDSSLRSASVAAPSSAPEDSEVDGLDAYMARMLEEGKRATPAAEKQRQPEPLRPQSSSFRQASPSDAASNNRPSSSASSPSDAFARGSASVSPPSAAPTSLAAPSTAPPRSGAAAVRPSRPPSPALVSAATVTPSNAVVAVAVAANSTPTAAAASSSLSLYQQLLVSQRTRRSPSLSVATAVGKRSPPIIAPATAPSAAHAPSSSVRRRSSSRSRPLPTKPASAPAAPAAALPCCSLAIGASPSGGGGVLPTRLLDVLELLRGSGAGGGGLTSRIGGGPETPIQLEWPYHRDLVLHELAQQLGEWSGGLQTSQQRSERPVTDADLTTLRVRVDELAAICGDHIPAEALVALMRELEGAASSASVSPNSNAAINGASDVANKENSTTEHLQPQQPEDDEDGDEENAFERGLGGANQRFLQTPQPRSSLPLQPADLNARQQHPLSTVKPVVKGISVTSSSRSGEWRTAAVAAPPLASASLDTPVTSLVDPSSSWLQHQLMSGVKAEMHQLNSQLSMLSQQLPPHSATGAGAAAAPSSSPAPALFSADAMPDAVQVDPLALAAASSPSAAVAATLTYRDPSGSVTRVRTHAPASASSSSITRPTVQVTSSSFRSPVSIVPSLPQPQPLPQRRPSHDFSAALAQQSQLQATLRQAEQLVRSMQAATAR